MAHLTLIHGIANKPAAEELHRIWRDALLGASSPLDLDAEGVTSEMVYWADVLYAEPMKAGELEAASETLEIARDDTESVEIPAATSTDESAWLESMSSRLGIDPDTSDFDEEMENADSGTVAKDLEWIPLPGPLKDRFLKRFLRDVHHYLFNAESTPRPGQTFKVQDEIRGRFVAAIKRGDAESGPHIVVSHSMGTVIAYDCLKRVADCPKVDALVTLGSPLGIDEVQQKLKPEWSRKDGFPGSKVAGTWLNIFDPMDVVSRLDPHLASDFKKSGQAVVEDKRQNHDGLWTHDIVKYLKGQVFSARLKALLGLAD